MTYSSHNDERQQSDAYLRSYSAVPQIKDQALPDLGSADGRMQLFREVQRRRPDSWLYYSR